MMSHDPLVQMAYSLRNTAKQFFANCSLLSGVLPLKFAWISILAYAFRVWWWVIWQIFFQRKQNNGYLSSVAMSLVRIRFFSMVTSQFKGVRLLKNVAYIFMPISLRMSKYKDNCFWQINRQHEARQLSCFKWWKLSQVILCFENFSSWIWRLPFALDVTLNLSNDKNSTRKTTAAFWRIQ